MAEKVLVIDDSQFMLRLIDRLLQSEGYEVRTASSGPQGLRLFHQIAPDLVILDIMMPGMDGWEVCQKLREISPVPIIFLTALNSEKNVVNGLLSGADDYLSKPFRADELRARVTAILRRARMPAKEPEILRFAGGTLVVNQTERLVFVDEEEIELSPLEYNLLLFMAKRAGRILPTEFIFENIWGSGADTGQDSVKWYIWRLRQKIEPDPQQPQLILTERGKGYRFSPH